jgi:choline dehydrogenase
MRDESEPEFEFNKRRIVQPRGKVPGGSSSINAWSMVVARRTISIIGAGSATSAGASTTCCPVFRKAEDQQRGDDEFHGLRRAAMRQRSTEPHELCDASIAAVEEVGFIRRHEGQRVWP